MAVQVNVISDVILITCYAFPAYWGWGRGAIKQVTRGGGGCTRIDVTTYIREIGVEFRGSNIRSCLQR